MCVCGFVKNCKFVVWLHIVNLCCCYKTFILSPKYFWCFYKNFFCHLGIFGVVTDICLIVFVFGVVMPFKIFIEHGTCQYQKKTLFLFLNFE